MFSFFKCSTLLNFFSLKRNHVQLGKNVQIRGHIFIINDRGTIIIGENTIINSSRRANPIGGEIKTVFVCSPGAQIKIGSGVGISNSVFISRKRIDIGNNVTIGGGCKFYDSDFHSLSLKDRINGDIGAKDSAVMIEDDVFIGGHSIILKGVKIGRGSIIGAGSVVTKDIPSMEIWAGNPARFIKKSC